MRFELTNLDEVKNLPPGKYHTRIVEATWQQISIEYTGKPYDPDNPCLLPITIHEKDAE